MLDAALTIPIAHPVVVKLEKSQVGAFVRPVFQLISCVVKRCKLFVQAIAT